MHPVTHCLNTSVLNPWLPSKLVTEDILWQFILLANLIIINLDGPSSQ